MVLLEFPLFHRGQSKSSLISNPAEAASSAYVHAVACNYTHAVHARICVLRIYHQYAIYHRLHDAWANGCRTSSALVQ